MSGRASRLELWGFFPVGLAVPILVASQMNWRAIEIWGVWRILVVLLVAQPLTSAISRRLHDVGEDGQQAYYPYMPFILLWLGYVVIYGGVIVGLFFPYMFWSLILVGVLALIVLGIAHVLAVLVSVFVTAHILGLLLLPSQTGPNRYGPNPHGK